jgi:hypothetical protein
MSGEVRIWRLRKNHAWLDARLNACPGSTDVELQFFYDGALLHARRWPSRDDAVSHADRQLRELQRVGWNTHW